MKSAFTFGVIVLLFSGCALGFVIAGVYLAGLIFGILGLGVYGYDVINFLSSLDEMKIKMDRDLADNPFRGLAEGMIGSFKLGNGAYIIGFGIILLLAGCIWGRSSK